MPRETDFELRPACSEDIPAIADLVRALADYEKLAHECEVDERELEEHLFGERPFAEVVLAFCDGKAVGQTFFFHTYSTFLSKPGIYLEDLFVLPDYRGRGIGKALLQNLVGIASDRGCARVEWAVLDWNKPAIEFYTEAFKARPNEGWMVYRLDKKAIAELVEP